MLPLTSDEVKRQMTVIKAYRLIGDVDTFAKAFARAFKSKGITGVKFKVAYSRDIHAELMYGRGDDSEVVNIHITAVDVFGDDENIPEFIAFLRKYCERELGRQYKNLCTEYDTLKKRNKSWQKFNKNKNILLENWKE